jgi:tetratricopeptide (TPR) repeat protein
LPGVAQHYERLARQTIQNTPDLSALGQTLMVLSVYTIGVGQWIKSQETTAQALELFEQLGYLDRSETCLELLAAIAYYQGQLSQAIDFANRLTLSARRRGNAVHSAWGLLDQATCRLRQGEVEQAVAWAEEALNLLKQSADLTTEIRAEGLLALCRLFQNDLSRAREGADKAAKLIATQPQPTSFNVFDGYTGLTEVYLALWERDPAAADDDLKRRAAQGCRLMQKYARIFPIGGPRASLYQGRLDWLANRPAAAHRAWQQSLAHAERLGMRLEAGLAHFEIARHLPADEAHRQNHLREASELFEQLGTKKPL